MTDEIALTVPRERPFYGVAHLVLGGLAARLDVTLEHLEDLQVALDGLLSTPAPTAEVTLRLAVEGDRIRAVVGPFEQATLDAELAREVPGAGSLSRVLATVVDTVDVADRAGGRWVELTKAVARGGSGGTG